ncbi:uncharacterized protein LOC130257325 [Oenanthe melanoleuca]|uniref:uncharacterized protein LOC130257325 n=1 Tax=Oenanthe melanoleuca TaxID=2939378 RepID=UPI0024C1D7D1|nr:uncharacterized protein LOC130257325 [Oenanthe melanoleuca]
MAAAGDDGGGNVGPGPPPGSPPGAEAAVAAPPSDRPAAPAGPEPRRKRRRVPGRSPPAGSGWSPSSRRLSWSRSRSRPSCSQWENAQPVPCFPQPPGAGPGSH